jgi:hypothetical protein
VSNDEGILALFSLITEAFEVLIKHDFNLRDMIFQEISGQFNIEHAHRETIESKYHKRQLNDINGKLLTLMNTPGKKRRKARTWNILRI